MIKKYEPIDIAGDIGLKAFGRTMEELFINSALGLYNFITEPSLIEEKRDINVAIESSTVENLLVSWLNELIFHFDTYGFIGKTIKINKLTFSRCSLRASLTGEDFNPERHVKKTLIKAATYHRLRIEKINNMWEADVIFDM
jgi:SHS2 domain-containing protein